MPSVPEALGANRWDRNKNKSFKCDFCLCINQNISPFYICFAKGSGWIAGMLSLSFSLICTWAQEEMDNVSYNTSFCYAAFVVPSELISEI